MAIIKVRTDIPISQQPKVVKSLNKVARAIHRNIKEFHKNKKNIVRDEL